MGVALYIVLDNEDPGFDPFVNGKAIAKETKGLDAISKKLGISKFDDFISMSSDDLAEFLDDDAELPEQDVKWFTADEGLAFVAALTSYIRSNPASVKNQADLLEDLTEYTEVFGKAKAVGAKWHLNIDI